MIIKTIIERVAIIIFWLLIESENLFYRQPDHYNTLQNTLYIYH